jgi:alanyl-tRNA synthetase
VRYGKVLEINQLFLNKIVSSVIEIYRNQYPEILRNKNFIEEQISVEEEKFTKTLKQGEQIFNKMMEKGHVSGKDAFVLFSTYGFPFELTKELADSKGYEISESEFKSEMGKHAELSKTASAGMFKGGLADSGEDTKKLHTAAHLMLESLRRVLGDHVSQKGSNINSERLRFDFSHSEKLTAEQIKKVEDMVNEQIDKRLPVSFEEMTLASARELGATGVFDSKYGEKVKVYSVGAGDNFFSKEICGGPHVDNTAAIGKFKIIKEESSSTGVRRIKAVLH